MSEKELQALIVGLARWAGYRYMHITDSRRSAAVGFPDLVLVHNETGRLLFVELKAEKGRVSDAQAEWMGALGRGYGHEVYVWRPRDWNDGTIQRALGATAAGVA